jgi:hypothetical protein
MWSVSPGRWWHPFMFIDPFGKAVSDWPSPDIRFSWATDTRKAWSWHLQRVFLGDFWSSNLIAKLKYKTMWVCFSSKKGCRWCCTCVPQTGCWSSCMHQHEGTWRWELSCSLPWLQQHAWACLWTTSDQHCCKCNVSWLLPSVQLVL